MKKLLLSIVLLGSTSSFAQSFEYGAKAGAGIGNLTGDYSQYNKSDLSYYVGFFGQYNINDKLFVKPEVRYSAIGSKEEVGFKSERNLSYLTIPVAIGYNITEKLNVSFAPRVSFLVDNKYSYDFSSLNKYNPNDPNNLNKGDLNEDLSSIDAGVGLIVSYDIINNLSIEIEAYKGIYNINKNGNIYNFNNSIIEQNPSKSIYTEMYNIGLSYKF